MGSKPSNELGESGRAAADNDAAPLNVAELLHRCVGRAEIAQMVLDRLESQVSNDFKAIEGALLAGDARAAAVAAHSLKGTAGASGARALLALVLRLEAAAKAEALGGAGEWLQNIRKEIDQIVAYMPAARAELMREQRKAKEQ